VLFRSAQEPSEDQLEELAARGIPVVSGEVAAVESGANGLTGVRLRSGQMVPRHAVAIMTRLEARAGFLADLGLVASEQYVGDVSIGTAIPAGPTGATDVPGVYVAGNVTNPMAQVIVAAGAGLSAGAAINADLMAEDTRNAVEHYRLGQPSHSMQ
jgi:thioredoxin reductase